MSRRTLSPRSALWLAALALAAPTGVLAQAQTGTGGGPSSTVTAPNTSTVGRTMPPSGAGGAAPREDRTERTPQMREDDRIQKGICIGCGAK